MKSAPTWSGSLPVCMNVSSGLLSDGPRLPRVPSTVGSFRLSRSVAAQSLSSSYTRSSNRSSRWAAEPSPPASSGRKPHEQRGWFCSEAGLKPAQTWVVSRPRSISANAPPENSFTLRRAFRRVISGDLSSRPFRWSSSMVSLALACSRAYSSMYSSLSRRASCRQLSRTPPSVRA